MAEAYAAGPPGGHEPGSGRRPDAEQAGDQLAERHCCIERRSIAEGTEPLTVRRCDNSLKRTISGRICRFQTSRYTPQEGPIAQRNSATWDDAKKLTSDG